jgi:hypothetical protein
MPSLELSALREANVFGPTICPQVQLAVLEVPLVALLYC